VLAHALLDAAEAQGGDRSCILAAAECTLGEGSGIGDWIAWSSFSRLISAACQETRDPAFGVHWAERTPSINFGIMASLALWAPSPRTALTTLTRYQGLLFQGQQIATFSVRAQNASVCFDVSSVQHAARRTWAEFVVVGMTLLLRRLCGQQSASVRATFDHAAPSHVQEYRRTLGHHVAFERSTCAIEFDTGSLDRAVPQFNERLCEAVLFEANCALARVNSGPCCGTRVREQLAAACPNVPTMHDLARKLGMSSRTLRRHLEHEGTAYPALVSEALRDHAMRLLGDPRTSIKEVGYALGFATPSAFHRAFKRWTGSSPSEARAGRPA
jgi:AraC-like DNA-binding protein